MAVCSETYREGEALSVAVRRILLVEHIIKRGDLPVLVGDLTEARLIRPRLCTRRS